MNGSHPMKRRAFLAGTTGLAAAGALAACGSSGTGGDGGGEDGSQGGNTVTVWHYFAEDNQVALMDKYKEMFEAENEGVTVENVFVPYDQLNSKVVNAAGSQTGPDVVVFNGAEASVLALAGGLRAIDEEWGSYEDASQFPDSVQHTIDGTLYAVQGYVNLLGLWCNVDKLTELGLEPPTTMEELEAAMATAQESGLAGITLSGLPQSQGEWQAYPWLSSQGFTYESPDEQALADGFAMVNDWVEKGYLSKEATTWDQTVPFQQFLAGEALFAANGNWQIAAAEADASFEYTVVPLPVGETGQVYLGGEGQAVGAFSQNPELAWQYLTSTYYSAEGQAAAVELVGSIPAREDAAQDPTVTENELLVPFSQTVAERGANYPSAAIPPEAVADVQTTVGQAWSAALGGQQDPEAAAQSVMQLLETLSA
jgi:ABC-type glycerol-3-phosphate transport system substrate-binding protein